MTFPVRATKPELPAEIKFNPICLKPQFFPDLLDAMANGELLIDLCKRISDESIASGGRGVKYSEVLGYITADERRMKAWNAAVKDGQSWLVNRLISELRAMGLIDIKDALNPDGTVRPIHEIPETLRRSIAGMEVKETYDEEGKLTGFIKTIKLADKHKSIEMLGKQLNMFVDKVVVSGDVKVTHHVEKYDLDERLAALRAGKVTFPPQTGAMGLPGAQAIQEATIIEKAGQDI
jgi:hypothetical protein